MDATDAITGTIFAGCKVMGKIGQGGMGSVYKARHEALDKVVCIKLLSPELAREQRNIDFFLREARSAAKLEHPNIVQVYNFGQENGSYFIVMSHVEGKTLSELVAEKGPFDAAQATEMIIGVLEGLAHAHSKGIVHRDIKPANILVGADRIPRIVDFGLARSISEEKQLTLAGEMVGTAYFMSPEQGLAGKVDARSDLYCAGATYFYILSGQYPFEGKNSIEVIHKHISSPFPNIILLKPDVPLWVSSVLEKLMRKKPEDRYQSARELIDDLKKRRDGQESSSLEKSFDIPAITARINAPPRPAPIETTAPLVDDLNAKTTGAAPAPDGASAGVQPAASLNLARILLHGALTLTAAGCFIISGASGGATGSLSAPFLHSPLTAGFFAVLGTAVLVSALVLKPLKFTLQRALFLAAAAVAAYAGGACIPAPETAGSMAKTFLALQIGLKNAFSSANLLIYAFFLYLAASKIVCRGNWIFKITAAAAYLLSLFFTYTYFRGAFAPEPEKAYFAAAGILAFTGILSAAAAKEFSLFFNPPLFFLAANLLVFAMFTNPAVSVITDEKERVEALRATQENSLAMAQYRGRVRAAESEQQYDVDGNPLEKKILIRRRK